MSISLTRRSFVRDVLIVSYREASDVRGREEILKVHAKDKPLAEDVNLEDVARTTAGFVGADLENLLNEAAIAAARDNRVYIVEEDIKKSFIKVGIGAEKKEPVSFPRKIKKSPLTTRLGMRFSSMYFRMSDRFIRFPSYRQGREQQGTQCHCRSVMRCI